MSNVRELVDNSIIDMMFNCPVYAHLVARIGYKVVNDTSLPYCAWTDGKCIFINEFGVEEQNKQYAKTPIDKKQMTFIIAHELSHILGLTWDRGKALGIDFKDTSVKGQCLNELWNVATDYEINSLLYNNRNNGTSSPIGRKPEWVLYDDKYINKTAEEIYKELLQQSKNDIDKMQQLVESLKDMLSKGNSGANSKTDSNSNEKSKGGDSKGKANGKGKPEDGDGDGKGKGQIELDKHMPIELNEMEMSDLKAQIETALSESGYSSDSSALERLKNFILKPVRFNWRQALRKYIKSFAKADFTWKKPARSGVYRGLILPSPDKRKMLKVAVAIDTSGSISDKQLNCFMNHLLSIASQFKQFKIDAWCFSTQVHEDTLVTYTERSRNIVGDFKLNSYGGTDISSNFEWVKKHYGSERPDTLIVFSDFEDRLHNDTTTRFDYCKCVWLVLNNKNFIPPKLIKADRFDYEDND